MRIYALLDRSYIWSLLTLGLGLFPVVLNIVCIPFSYYGAKEQHDTNICLAVHTSSH
jgi:hypothetical protein